MEVFFDSSVCESTENSRSDPVLRRKGVEDVKFVATRDEGTGRGTVDTKEESWGTERNGFGRRVSGRSRGIG